MARIRFTSHSRQLVKRLDLTESDIQYVIGNYREVTTDKDTGLQSATADLRGRMVRVVYRASEVGLLVLSVQMEVSDEANDR